MEYSRQLRKITTNGTESKFMANFNPLKSRREERKRRKNMRTKCKSRPKTEPKKSCGELYDLKGIHIASGLDLCDCLDTTCMGCFNPCRNSKCKSNKCGFECRQRRKFYYKLIEDQIVDKKRMNQIAIDSDPELNVIHVK